MRADGQTVTAPHHYIEALFKQVKFPNLEGYIKVNLISSVTIDSPIGFKLNHTYYKIELEYFVFNFSGFINEENLSVSLMCFNGKFGNYQIDGFRHRHHTEGHVYYNDNIKETLYYGEPFSEKHIIFVDPEDIKGFDDEVEIWILFGGKKSPQKRSIYKYDLHIIKERIVNPQPILIIENKLAIDAAIEIGKTKEELIKDLLNRE
jgi:hypothetical protein